jgi:hypothetical protein
MNSIWKTRIIRDHLYINDGKGKFSSDESAIPDLATSGSCVIAGDYDNDGDLDLFVGGRITPQHYPTPAKSTILRNDKGKFTDVTRKWRRTLKKEDLFVRHSGLILTTMAEPT